MRFDTKTTQRHLSTIGQWIRQLLAWRRPVPVPVRVPRGRSGLTLVEMLVTMAITLVMMGAVVNVFARIGDSVNDSRSSIEMSSMLRSARMKLQRDLAGATCPTIPWAKVDDAVGYFEIVEGPRSDIDPSVLTDGNPSNGELDPSTSIAPHAALASDSDVSYNVPPLPTPPRPNPNGLGDYDDILALTVRSNDEPFVGRSPNGPIKSHLAEVIWFAVENPADGSLGEPGMRTVYRRVLVIAPNATISTTNGDHQLFFRTHDISARWDEALMQWIPNSLADLTKRENRFAHFFDSSDATGRTSGSLRPWYGPFGFPHVLDQRNLIYPRTTPSPLHPFGRPYEDFIDYSGDLDFDPLPGNTDNRRGEDIVLADALAFDVRVFDPDAPVLLSTNSAISVRPGDRDWKDAVSHWSYTTANANGLASRGAYVDLGYAIRENVATTVNRWNLSGPSISPDRFSNFATDMHPRSQMGLATWLTSGFELANVFVYDTWSLHYENDGLNQDNMGTGVLLPQILRDGEVDEGTNGIDDPRVAGNINSREFGVDDVYERETSPPYPYPLRGVQVRLRVYERDSRQVREASVIQDFVP